MKQAIFSLVFLLIAAQAHAQLTLDECQCGAQANYPLVHQCGLIEKAREYDLPNTGKGYPSQFLLSGKAIYRSDIAELPVEIPGVNTRTAPRDQHQAMLELQQAIWDGGDIRNRKHPTRVASDVDIKKQCVDIHALNDHINRLFFDILLLDGQLKQNQLFQDDPGRTHKQVSDYIINNIATQNDLDAISVEQFNTKQRCIELETSRQAYTNMLSTLIGKETLAGIILRKPVPEDSDGMENGISSRPELRLFDVQGEQLRVQEVMLNVRLMPRFGLLVQGARGNPGLNMLKDEFDAFHMAGVCMPWNSSSLYTSKNSRRRIDNSHWQMETGRDVFPFSTHLQATQQGADVISMCRKIAGDDEIIHLREDIRHTAGAGMENGALTATDMLREITNKNLTRQIRALHEVQLLMNT